MPRAYLGVPSLNLSTNTIQRELNMKIQKLFALALAGSLALAMTACGGTETAADKGNTDTAAADTTTNETTDSTDTNTDLGGSTDNNTDNTDTNTDIGGNTGASNCASMADFNTCANCFAQENQAGAQAYSGALVQQCLCTNECQNDCTAECADPAAEFSATCDTCFQAAANDQQSGCLTGFSSQCQADQSCMAFVQALQTCPQN